MSESGRLIDVEIFLAGGHRHQLSLPEGSPHLVELFTALATGAGAGGFVQVPIKEGRAACSFHASQLVSVVTQPPVVIQDEAQGIGAGSAASEPEESEDAAPITIRPSRYAILENFLSPREHGDMLAYALASQERFEPGTVAGNRDRRRENLVIMDFAASAHATLLQNRLLTWLPVVCQGLGVPLFPVQLVESQLTAGNDGHFYRLHNDSGEGEPSPRTLSCVYYFFRNPKGFSGGELRLHDTECQGEATRASRAFRVLEPVANRLVVFESDAFHEVRPVSCPSRDFADSRFAVTTWIRRRESPDPNATFGWGQLRFGTVPRNFA